MKRPSYLGLAIAAGAILLLSIIVFRQYLPYTGNSLSPRKPPAIVLSMEDAFIVGFDNDRKQWSMKADKVEMTQNRSTTSVTGIKDGKIFENGKVALKVNAGSAIYDIYSKNLRLMNNIFVEDNDGTKIRGKAAEWNSSDATLRSIGQVELENRWNKITADKLLVNMKNKEAGMWNVRISVDMKEAERRVNQ